MRYKDFVWPHNPRTYVIEYERVMAVNKVPYGRYQLQDLGPTRRILRGEGEFVGEDAYRTFQSLATVFYQEGPGLLVHPVWQCANAYFVELSLAQEPRADYVRYTFTFWESYDDYVERLTPVGGTSASAGGGTGTGNNTAGTGTWHTVRRGESLWAIARQYGLSLGALIALNPQIKNPNLIYVGQKVRVA
ncbi:MAG TPA: LysM peptidoglycan-binding domain-containing protein [Candidatus Flavonifractor merdigallinarum]|uniref:LysM peptidoglycan-binding domain-containing protein n=1 Tax=Candidatus Flavonifractor merdigallinarum TaxID=2838589 RepID=A0A9D2BWX7_9FIRM|nr:LysM peptidoglycan-binding domain-containing protein [Candidatus Flavonifractor merdigallinarum]